MEPIYLHRSESFTPSAKTLSNQARTPPLNDLDRNGPSLR
jgi:hypothetical protein